MQEEGIEVIIKEEKAGLTLKEKNIDPFQDLDGQRFGPFIIQERFTLNHFMRTCPVVYICDHSWVLTSSKEAKKKGLP